MHVETGFVLLPSFYFAANWPSAWHAYARSTRLFFLALYGPLFFFFLRRQLSPPPPASLFSAMRRSRRRRRRRHQPDVCGAGGGGCGGRRFIGRKAVVGPRPLHAFATERGSGGGLQTGTLAIQERRRHLRQRQVGRWHDASLASAHATAATYA
jgi:hypothetical protein